MARRPILPAYRHRSQKQESRRLQEITADRPTKIQRGTDFWPPLLLTKKTVFPRTRTVSDPPLNLCMVMSEANIQFEKTPALKEEQAVRGTQGSATHLGGHPVVIHIERLVGKVNVSRVVQHERATNGTKKTAGRVAVCQKTLKSDRKARATTASRM